MESDVWAKTKDDASVEEEIPEVLGEKKEDSLEGSACIFTI